MLEVVNIIRPVIMHKKDNKKGAIFDTSQRKNVLTNAERRCIIQSEIEQGNEKQKV